MYASWRSFEQIISSKKLKISLTRDVNDPMENLVKTGKNNKRVFQAERIRSDLPPYFCFSKSVTHPLLWGHYGDVNRGVCLAFLFPIRKYNETSNLYEKYVLSEENTSAPQPWAAFADAEWGDVIYTSERVSGDNKNYSDNKLIYTKSTEWSYEEEVRCVCSYSSATECKDGKLYYGWPLQFLAGVVLGADCSYTKGYIEQKLNEVKDNNILFSLGIMDRWVVTRAMEHDVLYEYHACPWMNNCSCEKWMEACNLARTIKMLPYSVFSASYEVYLSKRNFPRVLPWSEWAMILKSFSLNEIASVFKTAKTSREVPYSRMGVRKEYIERIMRGNNGESGKLR